MSKKYKNYLIGSIVSFVLNFIILLINYIQEINGLSVLYVISLCFVVYYLIYWLYQLSKYALYHLMFGNFKKQSIIKKIIFILISVLLFFVSVFVILIENPKYSTLNDKLQEKNTLKNIKVFNRFNNEFTDFENYDFSKDKEKTIFGVEFNFLGNMKKYTIYKTDYRYQLLKAYLEIFNKKEKDKDIILNYLTLSFQAINYYSKETKEIKKKYNDLVKKLDKDNYQKQELLDIKQYLMDTKENNDRYNGIVRDMCLTPNFNEYNEVKTWHNYFKNESDKELVRVNNLIKDLTNKFQNEILVNYKEN